MLNPRPALIPLQTIQPPNTHRPHRRQTSVSPVSNAGQCIGNSLVSSKPSGRKTLPARAPARARVLAADVDGEEFEKAPGGPFPAPTISVGRCLELRTA